MDKIKLNNQVVDMRKYVKQAKIHIINKFTKEMKRLQNKKGNESQMSKYKRKSERLLEKIAILKKMKVDYVSKLALSKAKDWEVLLKQKNVPVQDQCLALLANFSAVQKEVEKFRSSHPDLALRISALIVEWEIKAQDPNRKKDKRIPALNKNKLPTKETSFPNSVQLDKKKLSHQQRLESHSVPQIDSDEKYLGNNKSGENNTNNNSSDDLGISGDESDCETDFFLNAKYCINTEQKNQMKIEDNEQSENDMNEEVQEESENESDAVENDNDMSEGDTEESDNESGGGVGKDINEELESGLNNYSNVQSKMSLTIEKSQNKFKNRKSSNAKFKKSKEVSTQNNAFNDSSDKDSNSVFKLLSSKCLEPKSVKKSVASETPDDINARLMKLSETRVKSTSMNSKNAETVLSHKEDPFFLNGDDMETNNSTLKEKHFADKNKFHKNRTDKLQYKPFNYKSKNRQESNNKYFGNKGFKDYGKQNSYFTKLDGKEQFSTRSRNSQGQNTFHSRNKRDFKTNISANFHNKNNSNQTKKDFKEDARKSPAKDEGPLHPSWEAKKKLKDAVKAKFSGKRIVFND